MVEVPLFLSNVLASLVTRKCLEAQEPIRSAVEFLQLFSDPKIPKYVSANYFDIFCCLCTYIGCLTDCHLFRVIVDLLLNR